MFRRIRTKGIIRLITRLYCMHICNLYWKEGIRCLTLLLSQTLFLKLLASTCNRIKKTKQHFFFTVHLQFNLISSALLSFSFNLFCCFEAIELIIFNTNLPYVPYPHAPVSTVSHKIHQHPSKKCAHNLAID